MSIRTFSNEIAKNFLNTGTNQWPLKKSTRSNHRKLSTGR